MVNNKQILTLSSIIILFFVLSTQTFAQSRPYEGPTDPASDRAALRVGKMNGNQMLMSFRNNSQVGYKYEVDGSKWPRDSEKGVQIFDFVAICIAAQVFLENDTIPVTDPARISLGTNLDTLHYVQTIWNYDDMFDRDPTGTIVWGLHAVPGYFNELSETPAISNDPNSWPPGGWPSRGFETKWPGEWNGRFGRGVFYPELESYFVANDAQDLEYVQANRRVKYFPRPGVKIGDINPNVTIQKGEPWGGLGLRIEVRGYQWNNPQTRDVVFWEYNVSNISDYDLPRTSFGYFMDMGNGNAFNYSDDADDLGGFVAEADMAYSWDSNNMGFGGYQPGTLGIAYLESPGIVGDNIDNDDDGITDEKRDNLALTLVGPTDGYSDLQKFMDFYGYNSLDQLREHWDADEDQDWIDGIDANGNGTYAELINGKWVAEPGETAGNDVGLDGVGPGDLNYFGPDADGTECNHKPDLLIGLNSEPNFGLNDISESDMLGLTAFHFIPWPGSDGIGAPKHDKELYQLIGVPGLVPFTGQPADYAPVFGSGPFVLHKGTTERISCALMGAYEDIPSLNARNAPYILLEKKKVVQLVYESDYRFARPPEMPTLSASAQDGKVVLTWDNTADKLTREALLGGENDFEGYKLYRSTSRSFEDAELVRDAFGNPAGKVPIYQCDLKNEYYGYANFGIVQGIAYFLGNNTGITHYYVDEDVQNGRTYYYALVAYDRGISDPGADLAPSENTFSIIVDENENIISTSKNVQIATPRQFATNYISPSIEVKTSDGFKGTANVSFNTVGEPALTAEKYRLNFIVDTVTVFGGNNPLFPGMAYIWRNSGFTLRDVADSNKIIMQETPENFSGENILFNAQPPYYYLNPNIKSDIFDGLTFEMTNNPSEGAEFDSTKTGWVIGSSPFKLTITPNSLKLFPWQTDIVFTGNDLTYTTRATNLSKILRVEGIVQFNKNKLLPNQTFNMFVENKNFIDSLTGGFYRLDIVAYDSNSTGQFELDADDIIVGYSSMVNGIMTWQATILTFNFRNVTSPEEFPKPGDIYRVDSKRPFTATDEFIVDVVRATKEMEQAAEDLDQIKVVPNPYIVTNEMEPAVRNINLNQRRLLMFTHIPSQCDIKIFTVSGYLVDEIKVDNAPGNGIVHWDLLTREDLEIAPGVYFYHVTSRATGNEKIGKFAVIK